MRKMSRYLLYLIVLTVFVTVMSGVIHFYFEKADGLWALYRIANDYLYYIPIITSLSILWPLVVKSRSEAQSPPAAQGFFTLVYIFAVLAGSVVFQELAVPKLHGLAVDSAVVKAKNIRSLRTEPDKTGKKFSVQEFYRLSSRPSRDNIAFAMGNSYLYFQKMTDGNGAFYVTGFRMISYTPQKKLDYVLASTYAKIVDQELLAVNPVYQQYSGGKMTFSKRVSGVKSVPLIYDPAGIYALSSIGTSRSASLIDIFLYNNFVYSSKINFHQLGNSVFNKIAYYISVILILIIVSSFGSAFASRRALSRDYFQTVCFYAVSFGAVSFLYDILISVINMIYGLVI